MKWRRHKICTGCEMIMFTTNHIHWFILSGYSEVGFKLLEVSLQNHSGTFPSLFDIHGMVHTRYGNSRFVLLKIIIWAYLLQKHSTFKELSSDMKALLFMKLLSVTKWHLFLSQYCSIWLWSNNDKWLYCGSLFTFTPKLDDCFPPARPCCGDYDVVAVERLSYLRAELSWSRTIQVPISRSAPMAQVVAP